MVLALERSPHNTAGGIHYKKPDFPEMVVIHGNPRGGGKFEYRDGELRVHEICQNHGSADTYVGK